MADREAVPYEENDQRPHRGGDESGALIRPIPADRLPDEGGEERASDSEHGGENEPRLFGPGESSRAMIPATKPTITVHRMGG